MYYLWNSIKNMYIYTTSYIIKLYNQTYNKTYKVLLELIKHTEKEKAKEKKPPVRMPFTVDDWDYLVTLHIR